MKLDVGAMRFLSDEDFRVLTAVEMGMKNHDIVPTKLIGSLSCLKLGGVGRAIRELHKHKLLHHECRQYDGYRLTSMGYDFLALRALSKRGVVASLGKSLGVGKEADVYMVSSESGEMYAMKVHRLGRTSFRAVKQKRDYLRHRKSASWMYFSRLAATREWAFLRALRDHGFPVPKPVDCNRHIVVMGLVDAYPLYQVKELGNPTVVCQTLLHLCTRLAQYGLIHGDLNEFNVLINEDEDITMIDFPQVVSTSHANAEMYFDRDVEGIRSFFSSRYEVLDEEMAVPSLESARSGEDAEQLPNLDLELEASGFTNEDVEEVRQELEASRNDRGLCPEPPKENLELGSEQGEAGDQTAEEDDGELEEARDTVNSSGCESSRAKEAIEENESVATCKQGRIDAARVVSTVRRERQKQARKAANKRNVTKDKQKLGMRREIAGTSLWSN